jgi:amino acid permease
VTVFLGPGILAMPYIMSRLGWVGSLAGLLIFFCLTLWTSSMLADVYQVCGGQRSVTDGICLHQHANAG